jgi:lycopene cyclase domain-containing protein
MSEYAIVLILVGLPTALLSLHPQSNTRGRLSSLFAAIALTALPFIFWDIWAYSRGHWDFNYTYIWKYSFFGLPIEELLFFFVVPFSSMYAWLVIKDFTTWEAFIKRIKNQ